MLAWLVALAYSAEPGAPDAPEPVVVPSTEPAVVPSTEPPTQPGLMPEGAATPEQPLPMPPPATGSFASRRIDAAVALYLAGETTQARRLLQAVLVDSDTLTAKDRQDAYAWLGDIQYAEQGLAAATSVLATLLAENPDYAMDPLLHPPEFCDAFEHLRSEVRTAPLARPKNPYPWQLGIPFGVGYFVEGKPIPGVVFGTLQVGGIVTSIVTRVEMAQRVDDKKTGESAIEHGSQEEKQFITLRALNVASACTGWAAWGIPFVVESARWSVSRRGPEVTTVELHANGLAISGRF